MPATEISRVAIPHTNAGYNLTDSAGFSTLTTGAGNGVKWLSEDDDLVILKNDTGGPAVFTFVIPASAAIAAYGGAITSPTVNVANGKTYLARLDSIFRDSSGFKTIECDVAGKVLVMNP